MANVFHILLGVLAFATAILCAPFARTERDTHSRESTAVSQAEGGEVGDLHELRAGISVLEKIAKTKLAGMLQVPQENRSVLDAQNKATGLRLSLGVTCHLHNLEAELQSLAVNSSEMMLLNLTTHHLVEDSCEWMRSLHMKLFPNTSFNFSCTQRQLSNLCEDLAILVFSESVKTQFQQYEANVIGHLSEENWLERNIGDGVPPQVLQVVTREFQRCRTENSTLICN